MKLKSDPIWPRRNLGKEDRGLGYPRGVAPTRDRVPLLLAHPGFGRSHLFEALHLFQKVTAVDEVVELDCGLAAAQIGHELFDGVGRILSMDSDGAQVSGISEADEKFGERVASFESQSAGPVRPADEILDQEKLVK